MTRFSRFFVMAAPSPPVDIFAPVILSVPFCFVIGVTVLACCTWLCRLTGGNSPATGESPPPNKGLKKKVLGSLLKSTYTAGNGDLLYPSGREGDSSIQCAICLTEFSDGEEIRIFPLCSHAFHVACIYKWLIYKWSCPSCRQILVPVKSQRCGHHASTAETQDQPPDDHQHPSQFPSATIPTFLV